MRGWLLVAVAGAGCSDGYDVRVTLTATDLQWIAYDASCDTADLPAPGSCHDWSDAGSPSPCAMTTCVTHAELLLGGQVVAEINDGNGGFVDHPPVADELVLTGCAKDMHIPLPTTLPAAPTVTSFVGTHVEWTVTPPIDVVTIDYGNGFFGSKCAVSPSTTSFDLGDGQQGWANLGAWDPLVTAAMSLGTAHVRAGAVTMGTAN